MNVLEILTEYLKQNGYDGLYNADQQCGCSFFDFIPCGNVCEDCRPAYKAHSNIENSYDFYMVPFKEKVSK